MTTTNDEFRLEGAPEALEARRPALEAMDPETMRSLRSVSPMLAVQNGLVLARQFRADRDAFAATFKQSAFDPDAWDDLDTRALAFWQADVLYRQAADPKGALPEVLAEARRLRRKLLDAAVYLFRDDETLGDRVRAIQAGQGHVDTADDLVQLDTLLSERLTDVEESSRVTREDLAAAGRLGVQLLSLVGQKASPTESAVAAARDLRVRAGSDFLRAASKIRAAAAFVFEEDAGRLARYPSLWSGRGREGGTRSPK